MKGSIHDCDYESELVYHGRARAQVQNDTTHVGYHNKPQKASPPIPSKPDLPEVLPVWILRDDLATFVKNKTTAAIKTTT
jgi:hypothetical protein